MDTSVIISDNTIKIEPHFLQIYEYAKKIHEKLGSGYKEHIYVTALNFHLHQNSILFNNEVIIPILYENIQLGYERADTIIYKPFECILEFKAQNNKLSSKEIIQLRKYLRNYDNNKIKTGILLNFNSSLECIIVTDNSNYNLHLSDIKGAL